jgi:adenylyltransferase/sulfurtransferase
MTQLPKNLDAGGLPTGYRLDAEWEVAPRDVEGLLKKPPAGFLLVDCRRADEWAIARIEGAVHVPLDQIGARADELEDKEGGRDGPVVVYCHHGMRSLRGAAILRQAGFGNVKSMAGGIEAWSVGVDASVPRY